MEIKELFTETTTIKINVVKINNQKLTKSIFNQINSAFPFDKDFNFVGDNFLGYVNDKSKFAIWTKNDKIYKTDIFEEIVPLSRFKPESMNLDLLKQVIFLPKYFETNDYAVDAEHEFNEYLKVSEVLKKEHLEKLIQIKTKAQEFYNELLNHQILL